MIIVQYASDHVPRHVHVYEDGKRLLKFDLESWTVIEGRMTPRARRALDLLRGEGRFGEES